MRGVSTQQKGEVTLRHKGDNTKAILIFIYIYIYIYIFFNLYIMSNKHFFIVSTELSANKAKIRGN